MSRKTVSRGAAAAALATLLTLASAAPSLAAPRHSREGLTVRTSAWSLVLDLSKRLVGWAFGIDLDRKLTGSSSGDTTEVGLGADPNGNQFGLDPTEPIGTPPVAGGGR